MQANNNRVVMGGVAILLMLCSLPLTWMTIENATLQINGSPFGRGQMSMPFPSFGNMSLVVTGLNGNITAGFQSPIWLLMVVGGVATLLLSLNDARITAIPAALILVLLAGVGLFLAAGLVATLGGEATLGLG